MVIGFNNLKLKSILLLFLLSGFLNDMNAQWEPVLEKEGVVVFNKPSKNGMSYYRIQTKINTSISDLYAFFTDFSGYPEWVNNCAYVKVYKSIPDTNYIYYSFFDMPWPASDRDGVSDLKVIKYTADTILVQALPASLEIPVKNNVIRVESFEEKYTLIALSKDSVWLVMEGAYDPGGWVPTWMVRKMMKHGPYDVVMKIKKLVE